MQNLILFICLIFGVYFSGEFSYKMTNSHNKPENKNNQLKNSIFYPDDI